MLGPKRGRGASYHTDEQQAFRDIVLGREATPRIASLCSAARHRGDVSSWLVQRESLHAGNLKGWMSVRVAHLNWRKRRTSGETAPFNCSRTLRAGSASPAAAGA